MHVPTLNELMVVGDQEIACARKTCDNTRRIIQKSWELNQDCRNIARRLPPGREENQTEGKRAERRSA